MSFFLHLSGALLLIGRYDWSGEYFAYAIRSYTISLFFYSLLFFLIAKLGKRALVLYICIFSFPDHWLRLDRFFSHVREKIFFSWQSTPSIPHPRIEFFPDGLRTIGLLPGEAILFFFIITMVGFIVYRFFRPAERLFFASLFALIIFETWIHLSLRSPYSYMPHFEQVGDYWYHNPLFPNGSGSVNSDYVWFRQGEEAFIGIKDVLSPLWDRMFPSFLSSAFSRYLHPYYVWIVINILSWICATVAVYHLSKGWMNERSARLAAYLMASSQGFILYVGQPFGYVLAYSLLPVILTAYKKVFLDREPLLKDVFYLGVLLALAALSYDFQPWWLAFLIMPYALKTNKKLQFLFVAISIGIYLFYHNLWRVLPMVTYHSTLNNPNLNPVAEALKEFLHFNFLKWPELTWQCINGSITFFLRVFSWWFLLALFGLKLVWNNARLRNFLLLLFLPAFLTYSLMEWSKTTYYLAFPRMVFSAFPAVYLLSGTALDFLMERGKSFRFAAWFLVFFHGIYVNMDVLGFPFIYMHWFYRGVTLHWVFKHVTF